MIFHIITMSTYGKGLSGGDRIWIELSKRIGKKYPVSIYLWEEGLAIAKREGLKNVKYILWSAKFWAEFGFYINYFARIVIAIVNSFRLRLDNSDNTILYSASEFWQDSIPAAILKLRHPKTIWIASWYQTAPNPFKGFKENGVLNILPNLRALLYWFVQLPIKPLIKNLVDFVFITSEPDKSLFPKLEERDHMLVIKGGVDLDKVKLFQKKNRNLPKLYDAVFQGRFHPQKGVIELINIWKKVIDKKKDAKLAMIGDGPLMESVKLEIKNEKLENNIKLFGYVFDGEEKYKIFSQSKIVLHPALYDSGGMAAAEAMAFGLPGVAFDLKALKTYYPSGMIKVTIEDHNKFAKQIIHLLNDQNFYQQISQQALTFIHDNWDWDSLTKKILYKLNQQ